MGTHWPIGRSPHQPLRHSAARGHADVAAELRDLAGVVLVRTGRRRRERAGHIALRPDARAAALDPGPGR